MPTRKKPAPSPAAHAPLKSRTPSAERSVAGETKPRNWSVRLLDLDYS
jgi:hypothetical protein